MEWLRYYRGRKPTSTLRRDRGVKLRLYARAGIPVDWIVDLVGHRIAINANPIQKGKKAPGYLDHDAQEIVVKGREWLRISVDELFDY